MPLVAGLPADGEVSYFDIATLPLYNQDLDANSPKEYEDFRAWVSGPLSWTTVPAALKNALDIASRPWGQNVWAGKPVLPASQSIAGLGGVVAHHVLRNSLDFLDMAIMHQPELYIGNTAGIGHNMLVYPIHLF